MDELGAAREANDGDAIDQHTEGKGHVKKMTVVDVSIIVCCNLTTGSYL